jgi:hypothetical protein
MDAQEKEAVADVQHENIQHEKAADDGVDDLKKIDTVAALHVDLENSGAIKGDDSDGRVNWTLKQVVATIFLAGLYVGKPLPARDPSNDTMVQHTKDFGLSQAPSSRCSSLEGLCHSSRQILEEQ